MNTQIYVSKNSHSPKNRVGKIVLFLFIGVVLYYTFGHNTLYTILAEVIWTFIFWVLPRIMKKLRRNQ